MFVLLADTTQSTILDLAGEAAKQGLGPFTPGSTFVPGSEGSLFGTFLGGLLNAVLIVGILFVLLYLIWGAIEWISSGGDKGKTEKARDRITQAVIGLIVLASTLVIFSLVQSFLGVNFFNFSGGNGGSAGGGGGGNTTTAGTCAGGVKVDSAPVNDGGAGHYCKDSSGSYTPAMVQCHGPNSTYPYVHYDPVSCVSGGKAFTW